MWEPQVENALHLLLIWSWGLLWELRRKKSGWWWGSWRGWSLLISTWHALWHKYQSKKAWWVAGQHSRNGWWCWIYRRSSGRSWWPGRVHPEAIDIRECGEAYADTPGHLHTVVQRVAYGHVAVMCHCCQHKLSEEKCYEKVTLYSSQQSWWSSSENQISQHLWGCCRGIAQIYQG